MLIANAVFYTLHNEPVFIVHVLCEVYIHIPVLIRNVLSKTQNGKPALLACILLETHTYNTRFMMALCL